ncbi:MAG TPA: hypothetical protein VE669_09365 [Actinomycetota bacterium]|jgi:tetratricopeptide (TPR) repeat protein|nr:hypothetical protein [Actinomycetota bacterium]
MIDAFGPGAVVATIAIALGGIGWPYLRRTPLPPLEPPADPLEERRRALVAELRAAGANPADEAGRTREAVERDLLRVLRALDRRAAGGRHRSEPATDAPATTGRRPGRWRTRIAILGSTAAVLSVASAGLAASLSPRSEGGDAATARGDPAVLADPGDVDARIRLGIRYLEQDRIAEATDQFLAVLTLEPDNAAANAHLGLILYLAGEPREGLRQVERALEVDPSYVPGRLFQGVILLRGLDRPRRAIAPLEIFVRDAPDGPDRETGRRLLDEARRRSG